ncbi:hypothetical protein LINGRAHAP2_LOCUS28707, partial [Linum grandiflorum]
MEVFTGAARDPGSSRPRSIQEAKEQIEIINHNFQECVKKLANNKDEIALARSTLSSLKSQDNTLRYHVTRRNQALDPLHLALDKLSFANNAYREKSSIRSLPEEDIDYRVLKSKMMHGKNSLQKERRLIREMKTNVGYCSSLEDVQSRIRRLNCRLICNNMFFAGKHEEDEEITIRRQMKLLELEKERVVANCVVGGKIWRSLGLRKDIRNQIDEEYKEAEKMRVTHKTVQAGVSRVTERLDRLLRRESKLRI